MRFHQRRVELVLATHTLPGRVHAAEDALLAWYGRRHAALKTHDPRQYHALLQRYARKLRRFTPLRIRIAELVFVAATRLGPRHSLLLRRLRAARGGPTVTDYHTLTSAAHHLELAAAAIMQGRLVAAQQAAEGITHDEAVRIAQASR